MILQEPLLVILVKLVDCIPTLPPPPKQGRGRPKTYPDHLIVKALVVMIIRRLYSAYALLAFLDQNTPLTRALRQLLTLPDGSFPSRRTWERRLQAVPDSLPGLIGVLGRHLVMLIQPWAQSGRAAAVDSTPLRANGGSGTKSTETKGLFPIPALIPKPIGTSQAITAGGMAGNCTLPVP
jgi:hypothetical protein